MLTFSKTFKKHLVKVSPRKNKGKGATFFLTFPFRKAGIPENQPT